MKAQLFEAQAGMEIRLENNVSFFSNEGETKEEFTTRVNEAVERDYVDSVEIEEVDASKYKKQGVKQLQKALPNKKGMEAEMVKDILIDRGALTEHPSEGGTVYNSTDGVEDLPEHEAAEAPKEKKERVSVEKPSLESIIALANEKRENVGKICDFKDFKTGEMTRGLIQSVWIDKRVPMVLYRIQELETLARKNKNVNSKELSVDEKATAENTKTATDESTE